MKRSGESVQVTAVSPDGRRSVMLWIREYDFRWKARYILKKPLWLERGSRIEIDVYFGDSAENPHNPGNPGQKPAGGRSIPDETCTVLLTCAFPAATGSREAGDLGLDQGGAPDLHAAAIQLNRLTSTVKAKVDRVSPLRN
jgi:hypothetical protein